ncbi:SNF2 domain-containing protein [Halospina denitrificans]|uniref:SNF2 domain-containing protein n=1 Tax=Halospina denitrificans TaxID=332522 RepID=A0A4R7K173_9GAMM|nr:SNF2-related protein [Halospina denitrificans]TDT44571.1 SNF2 domain-containing protein [Halospina denitrificans]
MENWPSKIITPGSRVRVVTAPDRIGTVTNRTDGTERRPRVYVAFDNEPQEAILVSSLEPIEDEPLSDYERFERGLFGGVHHLRKEITYRRLSGKLANLIYSLNTTNTHFLGYQFKPVLNFLDSPSNGILIADEVGLGKTIEAGLIWTELRARMDARRILIVCPAMLREKWVQELAARFGVNADIVDASELHKKLESASARPNEEFALVASLQGLRPPRGFEESDSKNGAAKLGRLLDQLGTETPLLDLAIVDEAHYLRNESSQTHKFGKLLRPVSENLVMLSATPVQLHNRDLFNLLNLLDEDAFPYESALEETLHSNAPLVGLRDKVLAGTAKPEDFTTALGEANDRSIFGESLQIEYLENNIPSEEELTEPQVRSEVANQIDRINPLNKVVSRTLKRDVTENRVLRMPAALSTKMSDVEQDFYERVTHKVRSYCADNSLATGFILTIPQRQMASSMPAACRAWQRKLTQQEKEIEEIIYELDGQDLEADADEPTQMSSLMEELVHISQEVGSYDQLKANDSKYNTLINNLKKYWKQYPQKKIILFAFYKETLYYLNERLSEDNVGSVVLHGGMDKNPIIREFQERDDQQILLSSEVAAEGVDLQFSSMLINYDLPWNPMKIEQRIGRIDRIGQAAERINIWNLIYEDSIDERVYTRLLERLDIFKVAMGSMETLLGDQIHQLTKDLLTHELNAEQEKERIEQTAMALENKLKQQTELEEAAPQLIAHGDFIQNKVRAAQELGRYIQGDDLFLYIRDYLTENYPGSRLIQADDAECYFCELSTAGRTDLSEFITHNNLHGKTQILSYKPKPLFFCNKQGISSSRCEKITQDHPLTRFVTKGLSAKPAGATDYAIHAMEVPRIEVGQISNGVYVYAIARWSISGALDTERLSYVVKNLETMESLSSDDAEFVVNTAALKGSDWNAARNEIDTEYAVDVFDETREELEEDFKRYSNAMDRENQDRVKMMIATLEKRLSNQTQKIQERIETYRQSGDQKKLRMVAPEEGKLKKLKTRLTDRIEELKKRQKVSVKSHFVAGGVIKIK